MFCRSRFGCEALFVWYCDDNFLSVGLPFNGSVKFFGDKANRCVGAVVFNKSLRVKLNFLAVRFYAALRRFFTSIILSC